jgi:hypothetical protein
MKLSKLIRRTHMYLALFLTPWLLIYAGSGLVLNHAKLFMPAQGDKAMSFQKVEDREYQAAFSADADPRMIAAQVLEDIGLAGTFNVQGGSSAQRMVILRNSSFSAHRITYDRDQNRLLIEQQKFNIPIFLNRSHFRHGYEQPYPASILWAVILDLVVLSLIVWVLSGLWMWWEIKPARRWGAVFGLVGMGIFALLLSTI